MSDDQPPVPWNAWKTLKAVAAKGTASTLDVQKATGVSGTTAWHHLKVLHLHGYLTRQLFDNGQRGRPPRVFTITDKARTELASE